MIFKHIDMTFKKMITAAVLLTAILQARAQNWALSTNFPDYIALGTLNIRGDVAVARHWSVEAVYKYNPWTFRSGGDAEDQMQNRQITLATGPRWWPWNTFAGWWIQGQFQYQQYNRGGIWTKETTEADAFGVGIAGGYTYLVSGHWNLEFGFGMWGGYESFTKYACPRCGRITDSGTRPFLLPNDVLVSLVFTF